MRFNLFDRLGTACPPRARTSAGGGLATSRPAGIEAVASGHRRRPSRRGRGLQDRPPVAFTDGFEEREAEIVRTILERFLKVGRADRARLDADPYAAQRQALSLLCDHQRPEDWARGLPDPACIGGRDRTRGH